MSTLHEDVSQFNDALKTQINSTPPTGPFMTGAYNALSGVTTALDEMLETHKSDKED